MKIYPSLISADLLNLEHVITTLEDYANGYHIDVMDDHFVPNLTWGPAFVRAIRKATTLPLHVHLMVDNPHAWLERLSLQKDDIFIFHYEVFADDGKVGALIAAVKKLSWKVGIAINPATPVEKIFPYLSELDHLLLMSVEPGFSGQKFMPEVVKKIKPLCDERAEKGLSFTIGMDGGVGAENIADLGIAGVDEVGVASALFSSDDYVEALQELREKVL